MNAEGAPAGPGKGVPDRVADAAHRPQQIALERPLRDKRVRREESRRVDALVAEDGKQIVVIRPYVEDASRDVKEVRPLQRRLEAVIVQTFCGLGSGDSLGRRPVEGRPLVELLGADVVARSRRESFAPPLPNPPSLHPASLCRASVG